MYPPGPFAVPVPSFQQPVVPPGIYPFAGPLRYIPINCTWLPYIAGALTQLLLESTWDTGGDTDALLNVQGQVFDLISKISCIQLPTADEICGANGAGGDEMGCCLRWQNGVLQMKDNCGDWVDVPGLPGGVLQPGQPGDGQPQPQPDGGCQSYRVIVPSRGTTLIPTLVNSGDTVSINDPIGSTTEVDAVGRWNCPDGNLFFGGVCIDGTSTLDAGSYAPSLPVGQLLWVINGVYYDALTPLTIPGGISNQQIGLVVNYPTGGNYAGEISVFAEVCNNQSAEWTHTLDFTLSSHGFAQTGGGSAPIGQWSPGDGLIDTDGSSGAWYRGILMQNNSIAPFNLTQVDIVYTLTKGTYNLGPSNGLGVDALAGGGGVNEISILHASLSNGTNVMQTGSTPQSGTTGFAINFITDDDASSPSGFTGQCTVLKLIIHGTGSQPVWP